uniref:DUF1501 domain-containing protein n=1 Tax=Ningiella ruwaisensis TaxID=2364274 RepID=UPI00109F6060|nr:DUF1501 domain-containing protein [Ningiella ruwaisensis]
MKRRQFIQGVGSAMLLFNSLPSHALAKLAKASDKPHASKKLIWIFLRGAMDSLDAVVPLKDKALIALRGEYGQMAQQQALPIAPEFGLHPGLKFVKTLYDRNEASAVIASATTYRDRSHFEAQDHMESGFDLTDHESGWLGRAVGEYQGNSLAISQTTPIALKGSEQYPQTWYPSRLAAADADLLQRLEDIYQSDPLLSATLAQAISQSSQGSMAKDKKPRPDFQYLCEQCAEILRRDSMTSCAMLEMNGWDTHVNQAYRIKRQFERLDNGLKALHDALGSDWKNSLVLISTEFGRTAKLNGTSGTDHGTASCMFLLSGSFSTMPTSATNSRVLQGGRIYGRWPGLAELYEGRDLMPTSDVRGWMAKALESHWGLSQQQIKRVFPDVQS